VELEGIVLSVLLIDDDTDSLGVESSLEPPPSGARPVAQTGRKR